MPDGLNLLLTAITALAGVVAVLFWRLLAEMKGRRMDAARAQADEKDVRIRKLEAALNIVRTEKEAAQDAHLEEMKRNREKQEGFLRELVGATKDAAVEIRNLNENFRAGGG